MIKFLTISAFGWKNCTLVGKNQPLLPALLMTDTLSQCKTSRLANEYIGSPCYIGYLDIGCGSVGHIMVMMIMVVMDNGVII